MNSIERVDLLGLASHEGQFARTGQWGEQLPDLVSRTTNSAHQPQVPVTASQHQRLLFLDFKTSHADQTTQ